ncbi:hypothetical protein STEG23_029662, partial [Scotinomys teguina]
NNEKEKTVHVMFIESEDVANINAKLNKLSHQYLCNEDISNFKLESKQYFHNYCVVIVTAISKQKGSQRPSATVEHVYHKTNQGKQRGSGSYYKCDTLHKASNMTPLVKEPISK